MDISQQDDLQRNNPAPFGFGQTDEIEVDLASPWERMGAVVLNNIFSGLTYAPFFVWAWITAFLKEGGDSKMSKMEGVEVSMLFLLLLIPLAFQIYQLVILSKHGHTLGKKLLRLKVIKTDGSHAGFIGAFLLREVVYYIGIFIVMLICSLPWDDKVGNVVASAVYWLLSLACIIMMFAHKERRTLQDLLAGTVVVKLPR